MKIVKSFSQNDILDDSESSCSLSEESNANQPLTVQYKLGLIALIGTAFCALLVLVVYFGFWLNFDADDPVVLFVATGGLFVNSLDDISIITDNIEQHVVPSTSILNSQSCDGDVNRPVMDYPVKVKGAIGTVTPKNQVLICAGCCPLSNICYKYNQFNVSWDPADSLFVPRAFSSAANTTKGWWVTGGITKKGLTSTTELYKDEVWTIGPDLPRPMARHCMVSINLTHTLVIGGSTNKNNYSSETWLYIWEKNEWIRLANMLQPKRDHSCIYFELRGKSTGALVAGGEGQGGEVLASSEIYQILKGHWEENLKLPVPVSNATFVSSYGGRPVLVGGVQMKSLIAFETHIQKPRWFTVEKRLRVARESFVGLMVRESALPKCKN